MQRHPDLRPPIAALSLSLACGADLAVAVAYARYQKISATAALRLFRTGSEKSNP